MAKKVPPHPMQPLVWDGDVVRFRRNKIVEYLFNTGRLNLNDIACMPFDAEDRQQIAQLLGYSVSGYGELNYVTDDSYAEARAAADKMIAKKKRKEK